MADDRTPWVVAGPTAAGKTTVARQLAERAGRRFVDADDHHPPANVERMRSGLPLTEADRRPWLDTLVEVLGVGGPPPDAPDGGRTGLVLACSALRRAHRDHLRRAGPLRVVLLLPSPEEAVRRARERTDHFMPAELVTSQFDTLELPGQDEPDVVVVEVDGRSPGEVLDAAAAALRR